MQPSKSWTSKYLWGCTKGIKDIFSSLSAFLLEEGHVKLGNCFLDGMKIEGCYSCVKSGV
jgi:hypothetical protein